jgi:hypothetical protein
MDGEQKQEEKVKIEQFTPDEKKKIIDSLKEDIRKELFNWAKKWRGIIIGSLSIASVVGFIKMYDSVYKKVHENTSKYITESITTKFADPAIKTTLENVAIGQAKKIIEDEIKPAVQYIKEESHKEYSMLTKDIEEIKSEIVLFKEYLGDTKINFANEYNTLSNEVAIIKERNRLAELADNAIANGDSVAFEQLKSYISVPSKSEMVNAAKAELLRVKNFYIRTTRIKAKTFSFTSSDGEKLPDTEATTQVLLNSLAKDKDWRVRARSAQLLKSRKEKNVPDALLEAARSDLMLDVRKNALKSFNLLTGFPQADIFDYKPAINWWKENKQQFDEQIDKNKPSN